MRRSFRRITLGVFAVTLMTAAVLGYVARGDAAGTNICPGSVCLATVVSPHLTSAAPAEGFAAFAAGLFNNSSPSTATHLELKLVFKNVTDPLNPPLDATVTIDKSKIATLVDGSPVAATCSPARTATSALENVSSVTCSFPNLGGGHKAKLQLPFTPFDPTAPGSQISARLLATYGEGNGGANDTQTGPADTLTIAGSTGAGKCTAAGSQLASVSNSTLTASIGVPSYPAATTDQHLPCTPVGIAVSEDKINVGGVFGYVASLELPKVAGFAVVQHDVTPLPEKTTVKNLVIWESLFPTGNSNFNFKVPPCDSNGLPPSPAATGFSADTCVFDRSGLPKGGGRFIMHALGTLTDPRYTP